MSHMELEVNPMNRRSMALRCGVTATLTLLALSPAARSQGWTRTDQTIPIHIEWVNSCSGEERVVLDGTGTMTTWTIMQPDGTLNVRTRVVISASGTGATSGAHYTLNDSSVNRIDGLASLPFSLSTTRVARLVGAGVDDMFLHAIVHVKINADGTITHEMLDVTVRCHP